MFDVAGVPQEARNAYYELFDLYLLDRMN